MASYYTAHQQHPVPSFEKTLQNKMTHLLGAVEEVVVTALQKEPAQRYQSAGDFTEAIKVVQSKAKAEDEKHKRDMDMQAVKQVLLKEQARKLSEEGGTLYAQQKYEAALALFNQACSLDPNYTYAWNNKGAALKRLGRYEEALVAYDRAIQLDPNYASAWFRKGDVLERLGRHEEALEAYKKLKNLIP
jgi:tetratricopeptide (TPR) repeat protein